MNLRYMEKFKKLLYLIFLIYNLKKHHVVYGKKLRGNRISIKNIGEIKIGNKVFLNSYPDGDLYKTGL